MKKLITVLISLILILSCFVSAYAVKIYEVDYQTGEIVDSDTGETSTTMKISANCYYDKIEKEYVYSIGSAESTTLRSSVYGGMVVTKPVSLKLGTAAKVEIYKNGELIEPEDMTNISEIGSYVVTKQDKTETILTFRIVSPKTCAIDIYKIPDIFYIVSATKNGEIMYVSGNDVDLSEDASYSIEYRSKRSNLTYNLDVEIDHTPPELIIHGVDEDGKARGPVSFEQTEYGATLQVIRDGVDVTSYTKNEYTEAGTYVVKYTDEAGNTSTYYFTMNVYLNVGGWLFVTAAIAIIVLVGGFMIYSRKKTRVR